MERPKLIKVPAKVYKWLDGIRRRDARKWGTKFGYVPSMSLTLYKLAEGYEILRKQRTRTGRYYS